MRWKGYCATTNNRQVGHNSIMPLQNLYSRGLTVFIGGKRAKLNYLKFAKYLQ